jgi:hypothetical protein
MKKCGHKSKAGLSLAEAMIAVVMLGFAAAGVLLPFASGAAVQAEGVRRTLAAKLAADLMEYQQSLSYLSGQPYNGTSTESEGNLTDYNTFTVLTDPLYAKFSREIRLVSIYVPQESGLGELKFILFTVRVFYEGREMASITRLKSYF